MRYSVQPGRNTKNELQATFVEDGPHPLLFVYSGLANHGLLVAQQLPQTRTQKRVRYVYFLLRHESPALFNSHPWLLRPSAVTDL